jgi:CO dehydrogenase maturation factor
MKIAVTGKGGVGKTTVSASLADLYAREGKKVLAVDADPDANLAAAFGLKPADVLALKPIAEMGDLIEERTGQKPGSMGGLFKLNPRVDDIPEEFGLRFGNIILLVTGRSKEAASGCYCPESVFLRRLLKHLVTERDEVVIIDMEAGIEHLTRGTAEGVNAFIVVVEPGMRSIQTALTVLRMASELGVKHVFAVANKVKPGASGGDLEFIRKNLGAIPIIGNIPYDPAISEADMLGVPPFELSPVLSAEIKKIKEELEKSVR